MKGSRALAAAALLLALGGTACGSSGRDDGGPTLRVFAASSLTEVFTALAEEFEAGHEDVEVVLTFGGSPSLVAQLEQGATADVLATADAESMRSALGVETVIAPTEVFARNRLTILVGRGNPRGIDDLEDLAADDVLVAVCAAEVPCGRVTERALDRVGLPRPRGTREESVKGVVAKVVLGEVDAGLVYATDARTVAAETDVVDFPGADDEALTTEAVVGVTADAAAGDLARSWIELLRSDAGRRVLVDHGFLEP